MTDTPWAVLLCKFSDDDSEPYGRARYDEIFTTSGSGKWNMTDFFRDMSHGKVDLSGSKVFGWYTLDKKRSDYVGTGANPQGRKDLIAWAKAKATEDDVDLSTFFAVVVVMNVATDLFGGSSGVVCDDDAANNDLPALSPSYLGQEMGHVYGLKHSRQEGSTAAYMDPWDVMSVAAATMAPHPVHTDLDMFGQPVFRIGPGLNAANMFGQGWLDDTRVWSVADNQQISTAAQIRPLHRLDLPGFLAIRFHDYFIEFRTNSGWDAAITPTVLVHRYEDGISYLQSDQNGLQDFGPGSFIGTPEKMSLFGSMTKIQVVGIDLEQQMATLNLIHSPADVPQYFGPERPYRNPGVAWAELVGPDEALVVLDRNAVRISRRSPLFQVLQNILVHESVADLPSAKLRDDVRREALSSIADLARGWLAADEFRVPASPAARPDRP